MKTIKRLLLSLALLIFGFTPRLGAVTAYPEMIRFCQPDGKTTLSIYLLGDEKVHWAETVDGYSLVHDSEGAFVYAVRDEKGDMVPSGIVATDIDQRSEEAAILLSSTQKHLRYSQSQVAAMRSIWEDMSKMRVKAGQMKSVTGHRRFLVVLFEFQDRQFIHTRNEFRNLFNQVGYNLHRATGSVHDYYYEVSHGQFDLSVDVVGPYQGVYNTGHYGEDDGGYQDFAEEAVQYASADVDFSNYDNDQDGYIDGMHIIFAGFGEEAGASSECIWSHKWNIFSSPVHNNTVVNVYSCSPELSGNMGENMTNIGVICHELGHVFGAPDYYDTDYASSGGQYPGLGKWDIMSSGSWNNSGITPAHHNPYTKIYIYQWATVHVLENPERVLLHSVTESNTDFYQVNTATEGDFFLIENRQRQVWDGGIPGHGMVVYHKHPDAHGSSVSNRTHPMQLYIVSPTANGYNYPTSDVNSYGAVDNEGTPFPGSMRIDSLTDNSSPRFRAWSKSRNCKPIYHISESTEERTVAFCFKSAQPELFGFTAQEVSNHQIRLDWTQYGSYNNVVVMSTDSVVERPTYYPMSSNRDTLPGGDIIVYRGSAGHTLVDSLEQGRTYYFHIYLHLGDTLFSDGLQASESITMCPSTQWRTESFEAPSACWRDAMIAASSPRWDISTTAASEGTHCMAIEDNAVYEVLYASKLVSAPFRFDTISNVVVTFDAMFRNSSPMNPLTVIYRSSPSAQWDTVATILPDSAETSWKNCAISMPDASEYSLLAFYLPQMTGGSAVYLDNFNIRKGYLVNITYGEHGQVWPAGNAVHEKDDTVLIAMRGVGGYGLKSFYVDGRSRLSEVYRGVPGDTATTRPYYLFDLRIRGNHTVHAEFGINTDIEEADGKAEKMTLNLYPNPATNLLNIRIDGAESEAVLRLFDPTGHVMLQQRFMNDTQLNLDNLSAGCYFVQCTTREGVKVAKFIKR